MSVAYAATWWALPGTVGAGVLKTEKSSCSKPKSQAAQTRKLETIKHNLVWLFTELPRLGEPQAVPRARLEAFAPWSPSVPESCRLRGGRDWPPEDRPLVDVDPHALDGD